MINSAKKNYKFNKLLISFLIALAISTPVYSEVLRDLNLTILNTNDVHGRLAPINYNTSKQNAGGIARRAVLIKHLKQNNAKVLVLDAGDMAQGSLYYNFFSGIPDIKYMSEIGYDAATLGNHEFDKGIPALANMLSGANFPILSSNVRFIGDKKLDQLVKDYIIKEYNEFKIGIIGVTTPDLKTLTTSAPDIEVYDDIKTVKKIVNNIKNKVNLIVLLSHVGADEDINIAKAIPDIDIIVGGHSHTFINKPIEVSGTKHKTIIVQDGEFGINLGSIDLNIKKNEIVSYKYKIIPVNTCISSDDNIEKDVNLLTKKVEDMAYSIIGVLKTSAETSKNHSDNKLNTAGALVVNAIKSKFPEVEAVMINTGSIRTSLNAGNITYGEIIEFFPFDNVVEIVDLNGKQIKSILETSAQGISNGEKHFLQTLGIEYTINSSMPAQILSKQGDKILKEGNRISDIKIGGKPVLNNKYYTIATNDFIKAGGDSFTQFKKVKSSIKTECHIQDLIIEYIKNNSPLSLEIKDNIKQVNE